MRRLLPLSALAVAIIGGGLLGCSSKPVVREKPVADPLLVSKKPVEGKQNLGTSRAPLNEDIPPPPPPRDPPPPPPTARLAPRAGGR
jgi:hypothetical protein